MIRVGAARESRDAGELDEPVRLRVTLLLLLLLLLCCGWPDGGATAECFLRSDPPAGVPASGECVCVCASCRDSIWNLRFVVCEVSSSMG
ncbi:hypothetical protein Hanom_Chr07g00589141 [Helianthus anomalus]